MLSNSSIFEPFYSSTTKIQGDMKKLFFLLAFLFAGVMVTFAQSKNQEQAAQPAEAIQDVDGPQMTFETKVVDYGTIEQGSDPYRIFQFTNTGNEPLVIKNAKGSCGCTVPESPKEPIMPGESAEIKVRYDTKRVGPFTKTVTLTTNETKGTHMLTIKGKVEKKAEEPAGLPEKEAGIFNN